MKIIVYTNHDLEKQISSNAELTPMFLYFEHKGQYYPCHDWIDNPAVVLGWWVKSVMDLLNLGEGQGFRFMEGPYSLSSDVKKDLLVLSSDDGVVLWEIDLQEFARELLKAMNKASLIFHKMGVLDVSEGFNREIQDLRNQLHE